MRKFFPVIGKGLRWLGRVIWDNFLTLLRFTWKQLGILVQGASDGIAQALRRAMPWALGLIVVWVLLVKYPALGGQFIALGMMSGVLVFMFKKLFKSGGRG